MNQTQIFEAARPLLDVLQVYRDTAILKFKDNDQLQELKKVYLAIMPGAQIDLACSKCILHYLNMLLSYYEREYPKYQAALPESVQKACMTFPKHHPNTEKDQSVAQLQEEDMANALKAEETVQNKPKTASRAEILAKARASKKAK